METEWGALTWFYRTLGEREEKGGVGLGGPSFGTQVAQKCSLAKSYHLNYSKLQSTAYVSKPGLVVSLVMS